MEVGDEREGREIDREFEQERKHLHAGYNSGGDNKSMVVWGNGGP